MPQPYISRPSGTPMDKCMVYPLSPFTGAEAYMMYATASGDDKWSEIFAKLKAEADALRGARGIHINIALADEREAHRRHDQNEQPECESNHFDYIDFTRELCSWIETLAASPLRIEWINVISDETLKDKAIVTIFALPINIGDWWENSPA